MRNLSLSNLIVPFSCIHYNKWDLWAASIRFFLVPASPVCIFDFASYFSPINMMYIYTMCCCVTVICWVRHVPEMWIQDISELMIYRPEEAHTCWNPIGENYVFLTSPLKCVDCKAQLKLCAGLSEAFRLTDGLRAWDLTQTSDSVQNNLICAWGNSPEQFPNKPGFYS